MKKISIFVFLLLFAGQAEASFYLPKYDRDFIPYNHADATLVDFDACENVLDQYDTLYNRMDKKMALQNSTDRKYFKIDWTERLFLNETPVNSFSLLKTVTEEEIRDCLADYKEFEADKIVEQVEKKQKERAKDRFAKRQIAIQNSLKECDLEFFDRMNQKEKMQTFKERQQCKGGVKNTEPVSASSTTSTKTDSSTQKLELMQSLMKQVEMLMKQLAELKAKGV